MKSIERDILFLHDNIIKNRSIITSTSVSVFRVLSTHLYVLVLVSLLGIADIHKQSERREVNDRSRQNLARTMHAGVVRARACGTCRFHCHHASIMS